MELLKNFIFMCFHVFLNNFMKPSNNFIFIELQTINETIEKFYKTIEEFYFIELKKFNESIKKFYFRLFKNILMKLSNTFNFTYFEYF